MYAQRSWTDGFMLTVQECDVSFDPIAYRNRARYDSRTVTRTIPTARMKWFYVQSVRFRLSNGSNIRDAGH